MHTHYSMFGFLDSPYYVFYHIFLFFNSDLKKNLQPQNNMQFLQKKILFVVKSLHNVEATDFFTSQNEKKEKYGKIHIVGSLKNQTQSNECVYRPRIINFTILFQSSPMCIVELYTIEYFLFLFTVTVFKCFILIKACVTKHLFY